MRPAVARIDLAALRHNYQLARERHGGRAFAVIKADAYGHGAVRCAEALGDVVDGFAVAIMEEALSLREAGVRKPILVLEGVFEAHELEEAARRDLWLVVHSDAQLDMLARVPPSASLTLWLKLNSGMNRAGFEPDRAGEVLARVRESGHCAEIGWMTHLARADEPDCPSTADQIALFDRATRGLPGMRSIANSAGILGWSAARRDWARPGIMLYGADPMPGEAHGLRPVMQLRSRVMSVRELPPGTPVGYGARFVTARPTRVGLVAMGYADGYPRSAPDGTPVAVDGSLTQLIGRVSMDMLTVDLTELPNSGVGSEVELWGGHVSVNRVAEGAGTISYELLCNVKRVRFEYHDDASSF